MKKKFVGIFALVLLILVVFAGCTSQPKDKDQKPEEQKATYQSVFDEYSAKIQEKAPVLAEEFKTEAEPLKGDISALASLSGDKVKELAEISTEGGQKLAQVHLAEKDEDSVYMEWSQKLIEVYTEASKQITDAYTEIAMAG